MTTYVPRPAIVRARGPRQRRRWPAAAGSVALTAGACLLAAGCSSGGPSLNATSASGSSAGVSSAAGGPAGATSAGAGVPAARPAHAEGAAPAFAPGKASHAGAAAGAGLTAVPVSGGQAVIFTASLRLRASDVRATADRATQLAQAAGGYVSAEDETVTRSRHARPTVSIQFKIPSAAYQSTLAALAGLGTGRSQAQHAQDVTGTVADVNSRVASAQAAIAQLRKLLTRAGTVGGLLTVQEQINAEEADLEALQSQQRALARETSYATISMMITGIRTHAATHHAKSAAGFLAGLAAGWRALRVVVSGLLITAGAILPFVIPLGLVALAALTALRWRGRRRSASARPAD